ncbi:MAG: hypothetical protein RL885_16740 [Planctomycetota bacterium]
MGKAVGVVGDTVATASPGTAPSSKPTWTGNWQAGLVSETSYSWLQVKGIAVIHRAKCTFTFGGTDASGATVTMTSDVELVAGSTILQKGQSRVLVQGDSKTDSHGNRLAISAPGHLTTS